MCVVVESVSESTPVTSKWLALTTSSLGALLGAFMFTSVNVALQSLSKTFETEFNVVQWVVLAYLLASGTLLPIVGRWADIVGKKQLFILGYALFTVGSLLCGLAPGMGWLIAFRTLQGLGSAFLTALGLAIITDVFPSEERGRAIGINGSVLSAGIVIGPTLGGFLIDALTWRWIFFSAVPTGLVGMFLAYRFIAASRSGGGQRLDLAGSGLLFLALLSLSLALTLGQDAGFGSTLILTLFLSSVLLTTVFLGLELVVSDPVIELKLFRNPRLSVGLGIGLPTFIAISGTILLMPFYLENVLGYSPRNVGLLMSIAPISLIGAAPLAGAAADHFGERPIALIGLGILLTGYFAIGTLSESTTALGYLFRFLPIGLGMGIFQTPNSSAIMGSVPRERSGVAGGLLAMTRTLGSSAGIAVLGALWVARVNARAGAVVGTDATPAIQVAGLQDLFLAVQIMIGLAFLVALWDTFRPRRTALAMDGVRNSPQE